MTERTQRTIAFLRQKLGENPQFQADPAKGAYRLEHTFRVSRIGGEIARAEGMDEEAMVIACLLHDVSYCRPFLIGPDWRGHGRESAQVARPFLEGLDLAPAVVDQICFGIAIHVDDRSDFPGERTPFALTVGDADNIDRFDAYRLYDLLENVGFSRMSLVERTAHVERTLERLTPYLDMTFATATATALWRDRIGFYIDFYRRLEAQLAASGGDLDRSVLPQVPADLPRPDDFVLGVSGCF